jgi:hypothetical protein
MAVANGYGKVATSGSVFMYDTGDTRNSYTGEPTTNLLPNGVAAGHNSGAYGNVVTVTDATTEKGPGWKKVTISNRGNNFRIIQWTYIEMSANVTYCHSAEFDWGNMRDKGYFIYFDGNGTGGRTYYRPGNYSSAGSEQINSTMPNGKFAGTILHTATHTHAFFIGNYSINVSGLNDYFYYKEFQVEVNLHPTQFTTGTRSSTQGLLSLVGNSTFDLSYVSFDSNAQMIFDGTNDYVPITLSTSIGVYCLEMVWYNNNAIPNNDTVIGGPTTYQTPIEFNGNGSGVHLGAWTGGMTNEAIHIWGGGGATSNRVAAAVGYHHVVFNWNGTTYDIWVDGVNTTTYYQNGTTPAGLITATSIKLGRDVDNYCFNGQIPVTKIYNRTLSSAEVRQNYNKYKTRFNLP